MASRSFIRSRFAPVTTVSDIRWDLIFGLRVAPSVSC